MNDGMAVRMVLPTKRVRGEVSPSKIVLFVAAHPTRSGAPDWTRQPRLVAFVDGERGYMMNAVMAGGLPLVEAGLLALDGNVDKCAPVRLYHRVFCASGGHGMSAVMSGVRRAA